MAHRKEDDKLVATSISVSLSKKMKGPKEEEGKKEYLATRFFLKNSNCITD